MTLRESLFFYRSSNEIFVLLILYKIIQYNLKIIKLNYMNKKEIKEFLLQEETAAGFITDMIKNKDSYLGSIHLDKEYYKEKAQNAGNNNFDAEFFNKAMENAKAGNYSSAEAVAQQRKNKAMGIAQNKGLEHFWEDGSKEKFLTLVKAALTNPNIKGLDALDRAKLVFVLQAYLKLIPENIEIEKRADKETADNQKKIDEINKVEPNHYFAKRGKFGNEYASVQAESLNNIFELPAFNY